MSNYELIDGILSIPTFSGGSLIIEELPMSRYEKFYKLWLAAMQIFEANQESTFVTLYCADPQFRELMTRAMVTLGIEDPGQLSPKTMQALLMLHDGGPGLAFKLHEEIPQPGKHPRIERIPSQKGFLSRLTSSISEGLSRLSTWANQALYMSGLYALC
ncbi:hypothetical protein AHIS2_p094 [Acaryochloris phage A-HIS2]|nr:hypothetical protein AHIS2_p094 [Acaryochloris phage A-HIS2]